MKIKATFLLPICFFTIHFYACNNKSISKKIHLAWVHAYASHWQDDFKYLHRIYSMQVGQLPDSLQPKYGLPFCAYNFKLPNYFCTDAQLKSKADTTILLQTDTTKDYRTRTNTTLQYNSIGLLKSYTVNGQKDVYQASYTYNLDGKITIISEHNNKVECEYDYMGNITNLVLLDGNLKPLEKINFEYVYD